MDIQDVARNTFTISALLLTATLVILNYSWGRLKTLIGTMPTDKQRVQFKLKSIPSPIERAKYVYIDMQFISCILLALSFAGALSSVFIMSGVMVGDASGIHATDNFEFAVVAMRASVLFLFMGVFFFAAGYLEDLIAIYTRERSITTTKLIELLPRPAGDKTWSYILAGISFGFVIILAIIDVFVPFKQWGKMVIALATGIVLLIIARFCYRLYIRIQNRQVSTQGQPDDAGIE